MSTAAGVTLADLRPIDLFDDLDDEQLGEWLAVAQPFESQPGELLGEQGEELPGVLLIIEGDGAGAADRGWPRGGRRTPVRPTWTGAISVLTKGNLGVRVRAETVCRVAIIPAEDFRRLTLAQPPVHQRVMAQVAPVMNRITGIEQNRERLAALGHDGRRPRARAQQPGRGRGRARRLS